MKNYQLCLLHMSTQDPEPHSVELLREAVLDSLANKRYEYFDCPGMIREIYEAYVIFSENYLNLPRPLTK